VFFDRFRGRRGAQGRVSVEPTAPGPTLVGTRLDEVLSRVQKLLSLATSPEVHEAAAAAAAAQSLIEKYRLEQYLRADGGIGPEAVEDGQAHPIEVARRPRKWRVLLVCLLAELNGGLGYTMERGGETHVCMVGRRPDRELVATLFAALARRVEWCSATAGPGRSRAWHDSFRIGAVEAIADSLRRRQGEETAALASDLALRIIPEREAARREVDTFAASRLGLSRGRGIRVLPAAFEAGKKAGGELV
jgi:hypothetical protein